MSKKTRILVADDDGDYVEATRIILEANGFQVTSVTNGADCLREVKRERPDLILLDVMMATQLEGFRVSYELRQDQSTADIPVIMVSGVYREEPKLPPPKECGLQVAAFLEKPVDPDRLVACVREHLPA